MRVHLHDDQFDGQWHPWCGRGATAVGVDQFESTEPDLRCSLCERNWFPNGQPEWHLKAAKATVAKDAIERGMVEVSYARAAVACNGDAGQLGPSIPLALTKERNS